MWKRMNQCQTSLRDLGWGKTCSSPASINYHKRGVKTYEPVSNIAEEIWVGEKRAPPPPASINYHKRGVSVKHRWRDLSWGKTCPSQTFEIGAQVHNMYVCVPTFQQMQVQHVLKLHGIWGNCFIYKKKSISCDPFSIIQFSPAN